MSHGVDFLLTGKSHLRRAVAYHEESTREAGLCKKLRNIEVLQEVLSAAHQRSRLKFNQHQEADDLLNLFEAPDIICEWCRWLCPAYCAPCVGGRGTLGAQLLPAAGVVQTCAGP